MWIKVKAVKKNVLCLFFNQIKLLISCVWSIDLTYMLCICYNVHVLYLYLFSSVLVFLSFSHLLDRGEYHACVLSGVPSTTKDPLRSRAHFVTGRIILFLKR